MGVPGQTARSKKNNGNFKKNTSSQKLKITSTAQPKKKTQPKIIHQHHHHYIPKPKKKQDIHNKSTQTRKTGANTVQSSTQHCTSDFNRNFGTQSDVSFSSYSYVGEGDENFVYSMKLRQAKIEQEQYMSMVNTLATRINIVYRFPDETKIRQEIREKFDMTMKADFIRELGRTGSIVNDVYNVFCNMYNLNSTSTTVFSKFVSVLYP